LKNIVPISTINVKKNRATKNIYDAKVLSNPMTVYIKLWN